MAVITALVPADASDGYCDGTNFGNSYGYLGWYITTGRHQWTRFTPVNLAADAEPADAFLWYSLSNPGDVLAGPHGGVVHPKLFSLDTYGLAEDDSAAPGNNAAWVTDHGLHTTAKVSYRIPVIAGNSDYGGSCAWGFATPNMSAILTEIAARVGWNANQAMQFHTEVTGPDLGAYIYDGVTDYGDSAIRCPGLTFTPAGEVWARPMGVVTRSGGCAHTIKQSIAYPPDMRLGETLVAAIAADDNLTFTWPTGWTELFDTNNGAASPSLSVAWKKVDGSEGVEFYVTLSESAYTDTMCMRVAYAADPATTPPEGASATGTSTAPDPPSVAPVAGSKTYGVLAIYAADYGRTPSASPYSCCTQWGYFYTPSWTVGLGFCWGFVESDTIDPAAFTITSDEWVAGTVIFHPAASMAEGLLAAPNAGVWGFA